MCRRRARLQAKATQVEDLVVGVIKLNEFIAAIVSCSEGIRQQFADSWRFQANIARWDRGRDQSAPRHYIYDAGWRFVAGQQLAQTGRYVLGYVHRTYKSTTVIAGWLHRLPGAKARCLQNGAARLVNRLTLQERTRTDRQRLCAFDDGFRPSDVILKAGRD